MVGFKLGTTRAWDKEKKADKNRIHDLPNTWRALHPLSYENFWSSWHCSPWILVAQWIERPLCVREIMGSISVRDSDFFLCPTPVSGWSIHIFSSIFDFLGFFFFGKRETIWWSDGGQIAVDEEKKGHSKVESIFTFFTSVLMTCSTMHVIPRVSMSSTKGVNAVLPPKVVRLFLGPVAEFIRTPIHPWE